MKADFSGRLGEINRCIDEAFGSEFHRISDEIIMISLSAEAAGIVYLSPFSRKLVGSDLKFNVSLGLCFPPVESLMDNLWERSGPRDEPYCPLSCNAALLDPQIAIASKLPVNSLTDALKKLSVLIGRVVDAQMTRLASIQAAVNELEHEDSPWYGVLARENFYPVALLWLGRSAEALAAAESVWRTYAGGTLSPRREAYRKFIERLREHAA